MRNRILVTLVTAVTLSTSAHVAAERSKLDGDWVGTLEGAQLEVVLHVRSSGQSTVDSPMQNAYGMPATVSVADGKLQLTIPSVGARFEGTIEGERISGRFFQNEQQLQLVLVKRKAPAAAVPSTLQGDWEGVVGPNLPIVVHIRGRESTTDSPDQKVFGMPTEVSIDGKQVQIRIPSIDATFNGTHENATIDGTFVQRGSSFKLTLGKRVAGKAPAAGPGTASASSLEGSWTGNLGGPDLPIAVHIRRQGSTTDSPKQGAFGMPTTVTINGADVEISIPSVKAIFRGRVAGRRMTGTFTQHDGHFELSLRRQDR